MRRRRASIKVLQCHAVALDDEDDDEDGDDDDDDDDGQATSMACQVKSRVTRRWAQKHPGTKSGKQEETPSPKEAGSVCVCGRSTSFVEPGWDECTSAQVWPRHQAVALFSELVVKDARSA